MPTRLQVERLQARVARRMCAIYWKQRPNAVKTYIRVLISEAKLIGTPLARRTAKALLREMYNDIFGRDPVGRREFYRWVQSCLQELPGDGNRIPPDPIDNVSFDDAFNSSNDVIT